jgi:ribose transport system ATP-binding protein
VADWSDARGVLVLDEPTAALAAHEVDRLFALIRDISASGAAVVLVSHRLDEVMAIADRATVMRDGKSVWGGALADVSLERLVDMVAGTNRADPDASSETAWSQRQSAVRRATVLETRDVQGQYLRGVSLELSEGEILGVAGLLGSGREELPYVLAGGRTSGVTGTFTIGGSTSTRLTLKQARRLGVVLVPADRAAEATFAGFTTTESISLAALPGIRRRGVFRPGTERRLARRWLTAVHADEAYASRPISTLSGGNQQKVVLARSLSVVPKILVLSEPTAGIDVGARRVIYEELRRRADAGLAVVMASSDIEDLTACCHRVIALRNGRIAGDFTGGRLTKAAIAYAIEGAHDEGR